MTAQIRPNRMEVSDRFPMLGFAVRVDEPDVEAEVVLASDIALFSAENKTRRTAANFYSSREHGTLMVPRGDGIFVVAPEVLARFIGSDKLHFGLATGKSGNGGLKVDALPREGSPYVSLRGFTGRTLRRSFGSGRLATSPRLEWTGDAAKPGSEGAAPVRNGNGHANGSASGAGHVGVSSPTGDTGYDDGFGPLPEVAQRPAAPPAVSQSLAVVRTLSDEPVAATPPSVSTLGPIARAALKVAIMAAPPPFGTLFSVLIDAANALGCSVGFGPQVGAGLGAGGQLGVGVIFGKDGDLGVYGATEIDIGFITSISATANITIVQGGIDAFNGWNYALAISGGEGVVGGGAILLDTNSNFVGVSGNIGVGVGFSPIDFYVAAQRSWSTRVMALAQARAHGFAAEDAIGSAVMPQMPGDQRGRATRIGGGFAPRIGQALDLGLKPESLDPLLNLLDPPAMPQPLSYARSNGVGRAMNAPVWSIHWDDVDSIAQPTPNGCWATTLSMLIGWRDQVSIAPATIAGQCGRDIANGLPWDQRAAAAAALGLGTVQPQCYLPEGFAALLENHGPLYVGKMASSTNLSGHAVLVVGMYSDGTDHFLRVVDPWDRPVGVPGAPGGYLPTHNTGSRYIMKYEDFQTEYEMAADGNPAYVQIIYAGVPEGRAINRSIGAPVGFAMTYPPARAVPAPAQPMGASSWSVNWDDVDVAPQPTGGSCWATSAALLIGWRDSMSVMPQSVADRCGIPIVSTINHDQVQHVADTLGFTALQPQCYTPEGFRSLIATLGPLWVGKLGTISETWGHVVLVVGMYHDGTDHYLRIVDPLDRSPGTPGSPGKYPMTHVSGSRYIMRFADFQLEYEMAAGSKPEHVLILHVGGIGLRQPNRALAPPPGYAMAADGEGTTPPSDADIVLDPPPPPRARAMDAIGTVTAIGGFLPQIISDSSGDVSWELDQFRERKHPKDKAPTAPELYQDAVTVRLDKWPKAELYGIDEIYAWFKVDWQYNGKSLGNVRIGNIGTNDATGMKLKVRAQIMDDNILYDPGGIAALRVRFHYRFSRLIGGDLIAETNLQLFADGTYLEDGAWLQKSTI